MIKWHVCHGLSVVDSTSTWFKAKLLCEETFTQNAINSSCMGLWVPTVNEVMHCMTDCKTAWVSLSILCIFQNNWTVTILGCPSLCCYTMNMSLTSLVHWYSRDVLSISHHHSLVKDIDLQHCRKPHQLKTSCLYHLQTNHVPFHKCYIA